MCVYFDNAATTKPRPEALTEFAHVSEEIYANPNSAHAPGFAAERRLNACRAKITELVGANLEVVFMSSGSASNSLAMLGATQNSGARSAKRRVISSMAEHSSVRNVCKYLEMTGHEVIYLPLDNDGNINLNDLEDALGEQVSLVSLMHVNNETGVISDIESIYKVVKKKNQKSILHVDGVAGFGKHRLDARFIDVLTFASHKVNGPKGVGGLCFTKSLAQIYEVQGNDAGISGILRHGTPDLPAIAAFTKAADLAYENLIPNTEKVTLIKKYIIEQTKHMDRTINGKGDVSPYILNMSFTGVTAETLINQLSRRGVYVSAGSSCNSRKTDKNILRHYGIDRARVESSVRLSFSCSNTLKEAEYFVAALNDSLRMLRKFAKR